MTPTSDTPEDNLPDLFAFLMRGGIMGMSVRVITINLGEENISFDEQKEKVPEDNLPPLQLMNDKYNIMLKVSHTQYNEEYKPFQDLMKNMACSSETNILNIIKEEKPAAICIEADTEFALRSGLVSPIMMLMSENLEGTATLTKGLNFVSGENNTIMPHCQLLKAFRNQHLFNATTGDLLNGKELRIAEDTYQSDLEKAQPVQTENFTIRSVPGMK